MKKRNNMVIFGLMIALTASTVAYAATGPAYPEVPVSERTSNLAENQNFVDWSALRSSDIKTNGKLIFYDKYGNMMQNTRLAGGEVITNAEGVAIINGILIDGVNMTFYNIPSSESDYGWRQDPEKAVAENGISNWYYKNNGSLPLTSMWYWLSDQDNIFSTKKAYCFNEYGYLYVNTITPDGFIVNERGQIITEDGALIEHEIDATTHDKMNSRFMGSAIGKMRDDYFTICIFPQCGGECFTGANEKAFADRPSQYTYEENIRRRKERKENSSIYK